MCLSCVVVSQSVGEQRHLSFPVSYSAMRVKPASDTSAIANPSQHAPDVEQPRSNAIGVEDDDYDSSMSVQEAMQLELIKSRSNTETIRIEVFRPWVFLREFTYNMLAPFSIPAVYFWEGAEGLRRREMGLRLSLGTIKAGRPLLFLQSFLGFVWLVVPVCLWTTVWLSVTSWQDLSRSQCLVDILYVATIMPLHQLCVARKWAQ